MAGVRDRVVLAAAFTAGATVGAGWVVWQQLPGRHRPAAWVRHRLAAK